MNTELHITVEHGKHYWLIVASRFTVRSRESYSREYDARKAAKKEAKELGVRVNRA